VIFEGQYHYLSEFSEDIQKKYQFLYLVLKCIHNPSSDSFTQIADYYLATEENEFLCFLSDLAALRIDPVGEKSYNRAAVFANDFFNQRSEVEDLSQSTCSVSVIMPTYNRGEIIRESIESVLKQDHKAFELIIVNDGGDDEVKSIIDTFHDSRIRYVKILHSGLAGALNAGLKEAKGEYISYLDDDDIYYPDHLSMLLGISKRNNKEFVYAKSKVMHGYRDEKGSFIPVKEGRTHTLPYSKFTLATRLGISVINVLHKRVLINQIGLFNTELPWSMDWDFWMRMSDIHEPYFIDKWTSEYRKTLDNMTTSQLYKGNFYMHSLLAPYFSTAYGALTLYRAAYLLKKDEKEVWSYRLSEFFISQNEVLDTIFKTKGLLFDVGFLRKAIFDNNFRREYSIVKLVIHILRNFLLRLSNIYRKIMES
jgi:glycosyltransferase involved in cell wall biosynthesis